MKNSSTPVICILICLAPTLMAGQALQVQNHLYQTPLLQGANPWSSRLSTGTPLLRLRNTGPMGEDGVQIELTSLSLLPGPSFFLDCPVPIMPGTGAIRLQPSDLGTHLRLTTLDHPDYELIRMDIGDVAVAPYRPRVTLSKPLIPGAQSAIVIEPSEDSPYVRITNFGSSGQNGVRMHVGEFPANNSFFDVFHDINLGTELHAYSDPSNDVRFQRTFNKSTPKILERISSANPMMDSFFDVFYDLCLGTETRLYGDPDFDLLRITSYDLTAPKLSHRISSNHVDSFFDVFYDLNLATTGVGFGFDPDDLCLSHKYELNPPRLEAKVSTSDPMFTDILLTSYKLNPLEMKYSGNDLAETVVFAHQLLQISGQYVVPDRRKKDLLNYVL